MPIAGLPPQSTLNLPQELPSDFRVLIVHARWNFEIISALLNGAKDSLISKGVKEENITVQPVPGSWELPSAIDLLLENGKYDAALGIGVLIKGYTMHFEYISEAVSHALQRISVERKVPVVFGVLTCLSDEQAKDRAGIGGPEGNQGHNHGVDWGSACIEMGLLRRRALKL